MAIEKNKESDKLSKVNKAAVLSEASSFGRKQIKPLECRKTITKILYLIYNGVQFDTTEATILFFSITKLFQSRNTGLRKLVYLLIRDLSGMAQDVIMATSSLTNDINLQKDSLQGDAIRALCKITDSEMLQGIERFIKQGIVDSDPLISVSSIVSAYHLYQKNPDVVSRWTGEIQEVIHGWSNSLTSYHALGLIYKIRSMDPVFMLKLLSSNTNLLDASPMYICMIARYIHKLAREFNIADKVLFGRLEWMLTHKDDMVSCEAARVICDIPSIDQSILDSALSTLQLTLSSQSLISAFAALHTLEILSRTREDLINVFRPTLESLITHKNYNMSTLAITTLLRLSPDVNSKHIVSKITNVIEEVPDGNKIKILHAMKTSKNISHMVPHLKQMFIDSLREMGGYIYKNSLIDTMDIITRHRKEDFSSYMDIISEYLEDTDFPTLTVRSIKYLEDRINCVPDPIGYISHIYNRTVLDSGISSMNAVASIAMIGVRNKDMRSGIKDIIEICLKGFRGSDKDNAMIYLGIVENIDKIGDLVGETAYDYDTLEDSLNKYIDGGDYSQEFCIEDIPVVSKKDFLYPSKVSQPDKTQKDTPKKVDKSKFVKPQVNMDEIKEIIKPHISGDLDQESTIIISSEPSIISDLESGFCVSCVKHLLPSFWALDYSCKNTLDNVSLKNLKVIPNVAASEIDYVDYIQGNPIKILSSGGEARYICLLKRSERFKYTEMTISNVLDYTMVSTDNGSWKDDYNLDNMKIEYKDYIYQDIQCSDFARKWASIDESYQKNVSCKIHKTRTTKNVLESVKKLIGIPLYDSSSEDDQNGSKTSFRFCGRTIYDSELLLIASLYQSRKAVGADATVQVKIRSEDKEIAECVAKGLSN